MYLRRVQKKSPWHWHSYLAQCLLLYSTRGAENANNKESIAQISITKATLGSFKFLVIALQISEMYIAVYY